MSLSWDSYPKWLRQVSMSPKWGSIFSYVSGMLCSLWAIWSDSSSFQISISYWIGCDFWGWSHYFPKSPGNPHWLTKSYILGEITSQCRSTGLNSTMWGSEQFPPLGKCLQLDYHPRFIANLRHGTGLYPLSLTTLCLVMVPTLHILIIEDLLDFRLFSSAVAPR